MSEMMDAEDDPVQAIRAALARQSEIADQRREAGSAHGSAA